MAEPMSTSILLTWSPPQEPNGVIIAYEVTYSVNSSDPVVINTTDVTTSYTLELAPNTAVFDASVRGYTSIGPGNVSGHFGVSTVAPCELLLPKKSPTVNDGLIVMTETATTSYTLKLAPSTAVLGISSLHAYTSVGPGDVSGHFEVSTLAPCESLLHTV